eukprot:1717330-Pyramimonas_sp.AAC.1
MAAISAICFCFICASDGRVGLSTPLLPLKSSILPPGGGAALLPQTDQRVTNNTGWNDKDITPLSSRSVTGEFNSSPKYAWTPHAHVEP